MARGPTAASSRGRAAGVVDVPGMASGPGVDGVAGQCGDLHHARSQLLAGAKQGDGRGAVQALEVGFALFADDAHAIDHGIDTLQQRQPLPDRGQVAEVELKRAGHRLACRAAAGAGHVNAGGAQRLQHVGAHQSGGANDQYPHIASVTCFCKDRNTWVKI